MAFGFTLIFFVIALGTFVDAGPYTNISERMLKDDVTTSDKDNSLNENQNTERFVITIVLPNILFTFDFQIQC